MLSPLRALARAYVTSHRRAACAITPASAKYCSAWRKAINGRREEIKSPSYAGASLIALSVCARARANIMKVVINISILLKVAKTSKMARLIKFNEF